MDKNRDGPKNLFLQIKINSIKMQILTSDSICSQSLRSGHFTSSLQTLVLILLIMVSLYLYCHFGDQVTQRFEDVGDAVYQIDWYALPLDMQKNLPMVIALTQKRIFVRGFADTRSTREVFKKVGNIAIEIFKFTFLDQKCKPKMLVHFQILKNKFMYIMVTRKL